MIAKNHVALILAVLALLVAALGFFGAVAAGGAPFMLLAVAVIVLSA